MNRTITLHLVLGICCLQNLFSQQTFTHHFAINWSNSEILQFEGSVPSPVSPNIPAYAHSLRLPGKASLQISLDIIDEELVALGQADLLPSIKPDYVIHHLVNEDRGTWYAHIWFEPVRKDQAGNVFRIFSGTLEVALMNESGIISREGPEFKETSVLADGTVFQVAVSTNGVYKLDYNFIKDKFGVEPSSLSPDRVAIMGNGSGRIPQWNKAPRIDDLEQSASHAVGMDDGQINPGDYFLWYGEGPDSWSYDSSDHIYRQDNNIYDKVNHYYVIFNGPQRIEIAERSNGTGHDYIADKSIFFQRLEEEKANLLGRFRPPGSGQEWYGDELAVLKELDYTSRFDFNDFIPTDTFHFATHFAVRAEFVSRFYIHFDELPPFSRNMGSVTPGDFEASFATDAVIENSFIPGDNFSSIKVSYPSANGITARAWIDYIQLNSWRANNYRNGAPLVITDPRSRYLGTPGYQIANLPSNALIWDVSNSLEPVSQLYNTTGVTFTHENFSIEAKPSVFICFNPSSDILVPEFERAIEHQNIHGLQRADMVIVYHDEFAVAAEELAAHRSEHDNLVVVTIPVGQLVHEFGGGSKDPSAIRDFARMMYNRDPEFRYLLLIGDATYDYLNHATDVPYQNFVPAFETEESLDPIRSFPTDDFFALLDVEEGDNLIGAIDIAVGRFPVSTNDEAMEIVSKIIHYDTHPNTLRDWRNRIVIVADDEDFNVHVDQADRLAVKTNVKHPLLNQQKIYLDAFPQQSTPGGDRYPDVNAAIDLYMEKGALTVTYLGHGGPNGWTQERVLGINQAQSYSNLDNMPLFITATCSFAGYDEPGFKSTGEHLLINPNGGAIGLMTTVRPVFSGSNDRLTDEVLKILYTPDAHGEYFTVGEVLRRSKNVHQQDTTDNNARKFTLLGDPSLKLAIPKNEVVVTSIQGKPIDSLFVDTLSALENTIITGEIHDTQGALVSSFNGTLYLTLYDKVQVRKTLANDEKSAVRNFATQNRQLFKGTASVVDGKWTIEFVLPLDIDFSHGAGKFSFYAENAVTDATGFFTDIIVGGVSDEGLTDDNAPKVKLYLNNNSFRSGGIADNAPTLYAELEDDFGINVSGTGIGHDIEAILDGDDRNSFILNDFYQAAQDDHTRGVVRFPLSGLAPGRHTLSLSAWDLANNYGYDEIEFFVVADETTLLTQVVSYPNPFSDETRFAFEHNRPLASIEYEISIFSSSGQLVRTLKHDEPVSGGYRIDNVVWQGDGQQGGELGSGIYYYTVRATFTHDNQTEVVDSEAAKVVIIR